jgi:hypothetical protein
MKPTAEPAIIARRWFVEFVVGLIWEEVVDGWLGDLLCFGFGSRGRRGYAQAVVT